MQIVIDIDEDYVKIINKNGASNYPEEVIKNGTLLPKGHGRIIDESKIAVIIETEDRDDFITDAPTIIEADVPKRRKGTPLEENDSGYNCENWIP